MKYKGKTSKKLKVAVKESTKPESTPSPKPELEPEPEDIPGEGFTITYNKNSKNKSDKLKGSSTQKVATASGEILKFSTTVTPASGKKFLGWYDAPTGGNRIYETYKPTGNMTLYAHYTDENVQRVEFVLGCNYGGTYSFIGSGINHDMEYGWTDKKYYQGAMQYDDPENIAWEHSYVVELTKRLFL